MLCPVPSYLAGLGLLYAVSGTKLAYPRLLYAVSGPEVACRPTGVVCDVQYLASV